MAINQYFFARTLTPVQMDLLWADGWRHFGEYFFRYSIVEGENGDRHVVPLRIRLSEFQSSRSQKRIWNRNRDLETVIRPAFIDEEKSRLFDLHRERFSENVPDSLYTFLSPEPASVPCRTMEICLYLEGRMIAASFLDVGEIATSSVYSVFDTSHGGRSPGIYLILRSIEWSILNGKSLYYPGYAYQEPSHYDYKKRFNAVEGYTWVEWDSVETSSNGVVS